MSKNNHDKNHRKRTSKQSGYFFDTDLFSQHTQKFDSKLARKTLAPTIPSEPGLYFFRDRRDQLLYIGKAKNLKKRLAQYFAASSLRKQDMMTVASSIETLVTHSETEALFLEATLIQRHRPPYNRLLKSDSSFFFIKISNDDFPAVTLTRQRRLDDAIYLGPKQNGRETAKLLQFLRQIFKFRTSKKSEFQKGILSSDYFFWLDAGRSIFAKLKEKNPDQRTEPAQRHGLQITKSYDDYRADYRRIIDQIINFFQGDTDSIEQEIHARIATAVENQNFERAAVLRDNLLAIQRSTERQSVVLDTDASGFVGKILEFSQEFVLFFVRLRDGKISDLRRHKIPRKNLEQSALASSTQNFLQNFWEKNAEKKNAKNFEEKFKKNFEKNRAHEQIFQGIHAEFWPFTTRARTATSRKKIKKSEEFSDEIRCRDADRTRQPRRSELADLLEKMLEHFLLTQSDSTTNSELLASLQKKFSLKNFPFRIECLDISHLGGSRSSGGLVSFLGGAQNPHGYRRFKLSDTHGDDHLAITQVLEKRIARDGPIPDLLIIDGGLGQRKTAQKALKKFSQKFQKSDRKSVDLASIGKGPARRRAGKIIGQNEEFLSADRSTTTRPTKFPLDHDPISRLLTTVRDEAHRFANQYRKKQMSLDRQKSPPKNPPKNS